MYHIFHPESHPDLHIRFMPPGLQKQMHDQYDFNPTFNTIKPLILGGLILTILKRYCKTYFNTFNVCHSKSVAFTKKKKKKLPSASCSSN